ncbi:DUF5068 domain-containing protein [Ureibacillus aquaedulcis]|uniref:DUF5068 domain-containing protein n=1 Tax=Ureibacillus aquaedulcis TaxID=3058421 RepID=A0ABT8GUW9_9BACL|nr:DUF5068 domain-containing protein [Ureibacillus sp. BA0131]MDN4495210.1 DUF5068 domain-containing protein [Ureibacillus sp. BA0131]
MGKLSKTWGFLVAIILTSLILAACGSDKESTKAEQEVDVKAKASEETTEEVEKSEEEAVETTSSEANSGDISGLIKYMEEETQGTAKVLYENTEPQVHKMEGVTVTLDNYTLVELNDFHTDFSIPFNDQTNGGVIVAQYTVKNELDKDVYYTPFFYLSFTGAQKAYNNYRDLLPLEDQLSEKLSPTNDYLLKAGESVTGYYTYPFGQDDLQAALNVSTTAVEVPAALAVKEDFGSAIGKKGQFTLSLNTAGAEKVKSNEAFYQDKATVGDMGEKKMLKEESGIGKSETLGDVTVTLDGYQFTDFTPNEVEAPRFENFKTGVVLLTVKFNLDNKGSDAIGLSSLSSKLTVNDGTQYMFGEGMLLEYGYNDLIAAGESGELLQVYVLDKEQYVKIWQNKSFEVEVGPIRNQDAEDISKGKTAVFSF